MEPVPYSRLNSRQKENYNFAKVSAVLADYGFACIRLSADWNGADLLAVHIDGKTTLRVQLKGRLTFDQKYAGKGLHIAFPGPNGTCYLFPHDEALTLFPALQKTPGWGKNGAFSTGHLSRSAAGLLKQYQLAPAPR